VAAILHSEQHRLNAGVGEPREERLAQVVASFRAFCARQSGWELPGIACNIRADTFARAGRHRANTRPGFGIEDGS
jgi:hypothetical protein